MKNPNNLENIITNFFKELNAGNCIGSTEEVVKLLASAAEMFIRKKEWFQKYSSAGNSVLFPCIFNTFTRFLSDLPLKYNRCRELLIHIVDVILREQFKDLILMGRDLILSMQRVSKIFPNHWKTLIHQPQNLMPNFEGIPQLLSTKCSQTFNNTRIAFRLQFCLDRILLYRPDVIFSFHFDWLSADFLSGFDSSSLCAELIRFAIINQRYQTTEEKIKQGRNALFVYLVTNIAKKGIGEYQLSKLALIFDCLCTERENSNGSFVLDAVFMTLRYLLDKQPEVGNSVLELIVRTTLDFHPKVSAQIYQNLTNSFRLFLSMGGGVQALIENRQIDKNLRLALAEFLPEIYAKRTATNDANTPNTANNLSELDNESRMILEQASGDPKALLGNKAEKRKLRGSKSSDHELDQIKRGLLNEEVKREAKSLDELIPNLHERIRQTVENFRKAVEHSSNDDAIDPTDEARHLFTLVKEASDVLDKEQIKLLASCVLAICSHYLNEKQFYLEPTDSESFGKSDLASQLNQPIFMLFDCIYKAKSQKLVERKIWLSLLRQMAKQNSSIGYLYLYFLTNYLSKSNRIENTCYYEFVDVMKGDYKDRLSQDMKNCSIDCTLLFAFLLPYVLASFTEASGCLTIIESISVTLDEHQAYNLVSQMYMRGDLNLFKKDTFGEIFRTSLKWSTHAQNTFWQFVRADNVSLDWIFESLPIIRERRYPIACFNILNTLQYVEIDVSLSIARGLFVKSSEDNFTINLLNLIVTDADIQTALAQKLVSLLKANVKNEAFYKPTMPKAPTLEKRASVTYSNLETAFEHLQKISSIVPLKKGSLLLGFVKSEPLLKFYEDFKKQEKIFGEMQQKFGPLFNIWQNTEPDAAAKKKKPSKGRKLNDSGESKAKKPKIVVELSDTE
ncbi:Integrator complex subunit 3-like protein isoform X2 [Aphelenchoides bicaudatus]|nr:Integrator complex subunit 3-like protein isoform X2 [Aphelenchoides bicaudatus]